MIRVGVQVQPFDLAAEWAALAQGRTDIGGIGCFIGQVREDPGLAALVLEHYPAMTAPALHRIADAATARWSLLGCTLLHRVGRLIPGAPIVLVLAAAAHRQPALDATAYLIDWLKTESPFWKCEERTDGSRRWVEARDADTHARDRWISPAPAG